MDVPVHGQASFLAQANALMRKNLTFQKRNLRTNIRLVAFPVLLCVILIAVQNVIDSEFNKPKNKCGCTCVSTNGDGSCNKKVCGIQYSTLDQVGTCPISSPPKWPALLQVPRAEYRASRTGNSPYMDLPDDSCKATQSCPATILYTGGNQSLADRLAGNLFSMGSPSNISDYLDVLSNLLPGTDTYTRYVDFIEPAFLSDRPLYIVRPQCTVNFSLTVPIPIASTTLQQEVKCVQGLHLWRNSSSVVNDEMYKGYRQGNPQRKINEIITAYDFLTTNVNGLNMIIWYNATYKNDTGNVPTALVRVPRSLNMVSNAYLQFLKGTNVKMQLEYVKEMPQPGKKLSLDFASLLGALFYTFVIGLLFPVILTYLVYEKEEKLKIMMKMHGLGDGPYWIISYAYFFSISVIYIFLFVVFGSAIGLKFFRLNDYSIQLVFYFIYINMQIALAFLAATAFLNVKTAQALGYIYVFGSGLLAGFLFRFFLEDLSFSRHWIRVMEIIPAFSLYRGLYEFSDYAFTGNYMGTSGMRWSDLSNSANGMREVLVIMFIEWLLLLPLAYYIDQLTSSGSIIQKDPLFFLHCFRKKKPSASFRKPSLQKHGSKVFVDMEKPDVLQERETVEQLLLEPNESHAIICDNLKKVYPGKDGVPDKFAVRGLSLALPRGECFGMLGPNGAGKTTFISMMIGLTKPTSGTAYVQGLDLWSDMSKIYTSMGVCPQHDMLWDMLTGREHLLFYGRLKNLKGAALEQAVEESLKSVNLYHGGVGDKQARKYSGGMKRRLSVAISLIGDPKVVYMDEPSTGLDPASRNNLWNVVRRAKRDRAIILTTHSMEEAEVLCDRLGILVDGSLQCIGNPTELKGRYGGSYVFTMTTSVDEEHEVENLARQLSLNVNKIYHISGTQKFEFPKHEVRIADVFRAVENAKSRFTIQAWGLANTTLEDVFIKVARGAQVFNGLS